jgi:hypothetical protein
MTKKENGLLDSFNKDVQEIINEIKTIIGNGSGFF